MLDKAVVALGTQVRAQDGYAVRTVVENRLLPKGLCGVTVNGEKLPEGFVSMTREDIRRIYIPGAGGYLFPQGGCITVESYESGGETFLSVRVEHGIDPENGQYAYILLPDATAQETAGYDMSDIEILANDENVQAVREISSGLTGIVFHAAGEFAGVVAHQPMIAMLQKNSDKTNIAVCDPTQKRESMSYAVNGKTVQIACDSARGRGYRAVLEEE